MTTTGNRYQVSIEAAPPLPIIRMTRDFDATPAQLMRAHTEPELFARCVGPTAMVSTIQDWGATTGGRERAALETLPFEHLGGGRSRLHAQSLVDSFEVRDQWLASGMETGVE